MKRTNDMKGLLLRGSTWYYKKIVDGQRKVVSLETGDLNLAKAKRDQMLALVLTNKINDVKGPRAEKAGCSTTLAEVFKIYDVKAGVKARSAGANKSSLLGLVRKGLGKPDLTAEQITLGMITERLLENYQENLRAEYEAEAGSNEKARKMARDRADRTSKSTFGQAASVFGKNAKLVEKYRDAGLEIPECVVKFRSAKAEGRMSSKVYFPPNDETLAATFEKVEKLRDSDSPTLQEAYYMFWAALATGCRRNELADMTIDDLVELQGHLWVDGGLGKDGNRIQIPCVNWLVHAKAAHIPVNVLRELKARAIARGSADRLLFPGTQNDRQRIIPDALNEWLTSMGWKDEKKLHNVRAYIGSMIFEVNPRLAQVYLRHKSIETTEQAYTQFMTLKGALTFNPNIVPGGVATNVIQLPAKVA